LQRSRSHMWKHWVARATVPHEPFKSFEGASWFWKKLGQIFPELLAAVLMPNHLHLLLPAEIAASRKIAGLLSSTSVRSQVSGLWQPIPRPTNIHDLMHLRRQIRYVALNPCRKQLCGDPLEWYWSTYREVMGGAANPIQSTEKLSRILKESSRNFEVRFHSYVSSDPSVSVSGSPSPISVKPKEFSEQSIGEILGASASALRMKPDQVRNSAVLRNLFIHLAYRHGWKRPSYLAFICGVTNSAVHQMLRKGYPNGIQAAELCLGDKRLRGDNTLDFLRNSVKNVDIKT
jgi:hypothetical protein